MQTKNEGAPAEVLQDQGRGEEVENEACTNDIYRKEGKTQTREKCGARVVSLLSRRADVAQRGSQVCCGLGLILSEAR